MKNYILPLFKLPSGKKKFTTPFTSCIFSSLFFFVTFNQATAKTYTAIANGNWTSSSTWTCDPAGCTTPNAGDDINIPSPYTVTIPNNTSIDFTSGTTTINITGGTLAFGNPGSNLILTSSSVINWTSGSLIPSSNANHVAIQIGTWVYKHSGLSALSPPFQLNASGGMSLPIELIGFSVKSINTTAFLLHWQTASERNNEKFIVEHSTDGRAFSTIGEQRGAGTTLETQTYRFVHEEPAFGLNYYRLKQIDFDGRFDYSPVEVVNFGEIDKVSIYPTLTSGTLNIAAEEEAPFTAYVYNQHGALLLEQPFGAAKSKELDLSLLPNGSYIVAVLMDGQVYRERVLKF